MHKLKDTYTEALKTLASAFLTSAPRGLREYERVSLEAQAKGEPVTPRVYIELQRAGTNATIRAEFDTFHSDRVVDAAGDEYYECKFVGAVNWPCHGSTEPSIAMARLAFYQEAVEFAAELNAMFERPVYRLSRTKAQIEADKAARSTNVATVATPARSQRKAAS